MAPLLRRAWIATVTVLVVTALLAVNQAASAPGLFQQIKSRGKVVVATEAAYAPFEFVENGKMVGYDVDILHHIVKAWGVQLEHLDLPFAGILPGLLQRKYDFVATGLTILKERAVRYAFTLPVAATQMGILKLKGNTKVKGIDDLTGLRVGTPVPTGGPTIAFKAYNDMLAKKGKGAARVLYFQSNPDELLALKNRQIDIMVDNRVVLEQSIKKEPGTYELVGAFGNTTYIGWVTRPENTDLRDAISLEIRKLRDSGQLAQLQKKWFGFTMTIPDTGYLPEGAK